MDKFDEFIAIVEQIKRKENLLELERWKMGLKQEKSDKDLDSVENIMWDIDMLFHDLSTLTEEEWEKLEEWERTQAIDLRVCPFCLGQIECYPVTEFNYTIQCSKCGRIYGEE